MWSRIISSQCCCSGVKALPCCAQPGLEVGGDALGVGHEFVFLMHGEAHQAYEVGEDTRRAATADFCFVERGIGLPQRRFGQQIGRRVQGVGQGLDVLELQRRPGRAVVEDLQGGDFVAVFGDEGFEGLHQAFRALGGGGGEAGFDEGVLRDDVDDLVGLLAEFQEEVAEGGVWQWFHGFDEGGLDCGVRRNDGGGGDPLAPALTREGRGRIA
jgi:hypothetical protein